MSSIFERMRDQPVEMWVHRLGLKGVAGRRGSWGCPVGGKSDKGGIKVRDGQWYCHVCEVGGRDVAALLGHVAGLEGSALAEALEVLAAQSGIVVEHKQVVQRVSVAVGQIEQVKQWWNRAFLSGRRLRVAQWLLTRRQVDWVDAPVGWLDAGEVPERIAAYAPGPVWPLYSMVSGELRNAVIRASEPREGADVKYMPMLVGDGSMADADGWPLVYQVPRHRTVCLLAEGAMDSLILQGLVGDAAGVSVAGARCAGDILRVAEACMNVVGVSRVVVVPHRDLAHATKDGRLKPGAGVVACSSVLERYPGARALCVEGGAGDVNDMLAQAGVEQLRRWLAAGLEGVA